MLACHPGPATQCHLARLAPGCVHGPRSRDTSASSHPSVTLQTAPAHAAWRDMARVTSPRGAAALPPVRNRPATSPLAARTAPPAGGVRSHERQAKGTSSVWANHKARVSRCQLLASNLWRGRQGVWARDRSNGTCRARPDDCITSSSSAGAPSPPLPRRTCPLVQSSAGLAGKHARTHASEPRTWGTSPRSASEADAWAVRRKTRRGKLDTRW